MRSLLSVSGFQTSQRRAVWFRRKGLEQTGVRTCTVSVARLIIKSLTRPGKTETSPWSPDCHPLLPSVWSCICPKLSPFLLWMLVAGACCYLPRTLVIPDQTHWQLTCWLPRWSHLSLIPITSTTNPHHINHRPPSHQPDAMIAIQSWQPSLIPPTTSHSTSTDQPLQHVPPSIALLRRSTRASDQFEPSPWWHL